MNNSEAQLADRCAASDVVALEVMYRRHVRAVWRYAWSRTQSREAVTEIVQETFVRAMASIGEFQKRSSLLTWLLAIARSVAIDHWRGRRRHEGATGKASLRLVTDDAGPDDALERGETKNAVRAALAELPAAQRDVVVLCDLLGMKMREAADTLGWGQSRVKVTLFRARRKLRERLAGLEANGVTRSART
jgi:RNA polymerase sigma-70 factor (ECF subfamily)